MSQTLQVELFGLPVGTLEISGPLRSSPEDWVFTYQRDYLQTGAPAISVAMPLRETPVEVIAARARETVQAARR